MKTRPATIAASAALCLTLLGAGGAPPALADGDTDFVCYDLIGRDGSETLVCETFEDMKAECDLVDPEGTSDECAIVEKQVVMLGPVSPAVGGTPRGVKAADPAPQRSINAGFTILAAR